MNDTATGNTLKLIRVEIEAPLKAEIERLRGAIKDANEVLEQIETDSNEQAIAAVAGRCAERISRYLAE